METVEQKKINKKKLLFINVRREVKRISSYLSVKPTINEPKGKQIIFKKQNEKCFYSQLIKPEIYLSG